MKNFKKSDLKNGMVVETRNGHLYFVFNERLIRKYVWDRLTNWNEDLSSKNNLIEYDIIRVFNVDFNKVCCLNDLLKKSIASNSLCLLSDKTASTISISISSESFNSIFSFS